jgi:hypothetical protein
MTRAFLRLQPSGSIARTVYSGETPEATMAPGTMPAAVIGATVAEPVARRMSPPTRSRQCQLPLGAMFTEYKEWCVRMNKVWPLPPPTNSCSGRSGTSMIPSRSLLAA